MLVHVITDVTGSNATDGVMMCHVPAQTGFLKMLSLAMNTAKLAMHSKYSHYKQHDRAASELSIIHSRNHASDQLVNARAAAWRVISGDSDCQLAL
jgi:hypothetical protein